jgi:hypothetical protein
MDPQQLFGIDPLEHRADLSGCSDGDAHKAPQLKVPRECGIRFHYRAVETDRIAGVSNKAYGHKPPHFALRRGPVHSGRDREVTDRTTPAFVAEEGGEDARSCLGPCDGTHVGDLTHFVSALSVFVSDLLHV